MFQPQVIYSSTSLIIIAFFLVITHNCFDLQPIKRLVKKKLILRKLIAEYLSEPILALILFMGGMVAIAIAIIGKNQRSYLDEILAGIGFFIGAFMIFIGVSIYEKNEWEQSSTLLIFIGLGLSLFFRVFKKIRWASLISLIAGGVLGIVLYVISKSFAILVLTPMIILIIILFVIFLVYIVLRVLERVIDFFGGVISFRPILFFIGLLAIAESVMIFFGHPIQSFLTVD